jgi:ADP-ribose pyrophosphatase YjhB (NUDIX family)
MPFVRIELAVLAVQGDTLQVLLGCRAEAPYAGRWALPGGVLRIDLDDSQDAACQRTARERLGVELPGAKQLEAVGGRSRDPRAPWALSVVYRCTTLPSGLTTSPGKRMDELKWVAALAAAADARLAFDHAQLIGRAVASLQEEVDALSFPNGLIAEPFTLADLQATSQAVLGERRKLDKSSFRRRIDNAGCVEAVDGEVRAGAFRPAQLFRLR